ncbi:4265_t:CDS:1 [Funneliformis caledonium]|uniref:4265_t:CDS:1 n=1 Tax=Funneliformis caledonium TaxID=1117310 RepID=A0A9N9E2B6_9GLOM|nr:4265_t:CDS:1 [Funneliformis caledonium]
MASVDNIDTRLFKYIGIVSEGDVYSHNLVYIHTNEKQINVIINERTFFRLPYTSCELKFASTIVSNKVFTRLKEYIFEIIAHNELSADKTFLTCLLEKHEKSSCGKELELKLSQLITKIVTQ